MPPRLKPDPRGAESRPRQAQRSTRLTAARAAWAGEGAAVSYIAVIAEIARATGHAYVLFPELAALSHDVLKRPHGTWARAPLMLVLTPFLAGVVGTLVTGRMAFGLASVLLVVASSLLIIRILRSPIAPAISAGLLPLVLGDASWWYPPSLLVGLGLLAAISQIWRRVVPTPAPVVSIRDRIDDIVEETPHDYSWVPFFLLFIAGATLLAEWTGLHFLLFPPLVVAAFEMFAHAAVCPWAKRPLVLTVACTVIAAAGVALVGLLGPGPLAAACSLAVGVAVLRVFNLHVPPALAAGLLPLVISKPNFTFPASVGAGTLLLAASFLAWRKLSRRRPLKVSLKAP